MPRGDDKINWQTIVPIFGVITIDAIGMGVILPLLPFYAQRFGATPVTLGFLVSVFAVSQFFAAPWLGKLSDRYGRKPILMISQAGTLASLVILASAHSLPIVFCARALDGITSGNMAVAMAYAIDRSTPVTRRRVVGIMSAAAGIGMLVGPALSAALVHLSIEAPIWGAAGLSSVSILASAVFLRNGTAEAGRPTGRETLLAMLRAPKVLPVFAILGLLYFGFAMYMSQLALFMQAKYSWHGAALGPQAVGIAFALQGIINIAMQFFIFKWIDRLFPEEMLAVVSMLLASVGFAVLATTPGIGGLAAGLLIISLGVSINRPVIMAALSATAPPARQGALMGLNTSLIAVCNMTAPVAAGVLIARHWHAGWAWSISALMLSGACLAWLLVANGRWPGAEAPARPETDRGNALP